MAQLFKKNIIKEKLEDFEINNFEEKLEIVKKWYNDYHNGSLKTDKEISRAPGWTQDFLGSILDYTRKPSENHTYDTEYSISGQRPDFVLGHFNNEENLVVGELKDAKTSLDAPQKREGSVSPVQQAFKYKGGLRDCQFVIVSNFYEIRLYNDNHLDYEVWTLDSLVDPENNYYNFRKFYYLLCEKNLISKKSESTTKSLLSFTRITEKEITKQFYKEYTILRKELFKDIVSNNPGFKKSELDFLLNKTQKIIDRIIFIHFCEDLDLLPNGKLKENILRAEEIGFSPWEMLKKFFEFINSGSEKLGIPDGYNGGLFAYDKDLDNLKVGDKICKKFIDLGIYDFADDLTVNILGHIFEQSISDIEELKDKIKTSPLAPLLSGEGNSKVSKRKKDGVFYTPEYIVDYIVKNSVGKKIEDWEKELKEKHNLKDNITDKNYEKRAIRVYEELQEKVQNIKVLDPACGSGAFLVKVFDFLLQKNVEISKTLEDLGINQGLFSSEGYFKSILQNNIYGVDLNEESVEITKLSLWLKTASKGKKLANLDSNIKCGNSLIDDKEIAGDKAFIWETEFSEIFDDGGFDIVVGNPPYVLCQPSNTDEITLNYFKDNYKVASYKIDLYHLFYEKSINILKKGGELGFITPNTYFTNKYIVKLREFILNNSNIKTVILFEDGVFEGASVDTSIILLQKNNIENDNIIFTGIMDTFGSIEERENFKQIDFDKNENKEFNFNKTFEFDKLLENTLKLEEIMKVYFGIQAYNKKSSTFKEKIRDNYLPIIDGGDINDFSPSNNSNFFDYKDENIKSGGDMEVYKKERIVVSQIGKVPKVGFCDKGILTSNTIYNLYLDKKTTFNIKYILLVLNSSFIKFYWNENFSDNKQLFPKIKGYQLKQLPIKNISLSEQQPFIEKADFMLDKNKELQEKVNKFIKRLNSSFEIDGSTPGGGKLSKKLENFYELEFSEFVKELKKKKVELNLKDQDEWEDYFDSYKKEILELKNEIDNCDGEIDEMVFDLYGLDEGEREVVLGSN